MRKLLFFFLGLLGRWQKLLRGLRGVSTADLQERRIVTGEAWAEFCDQLKAAGHVLHYPGAPGDPFQQAEGIRYLTRLTRAGLEAFVEHNDPSFPHLRSMVHETVKMGADNPDNLYMNAQISGEYEYRIEGRRNSVNHISFHTQNGVYGSARGMEPCGKLRNSELVTGEDGSFEIILSREPRGMNWLRIEPETRLLIVRQTFLDHRTETPAELRLVNLNGTVRPEPLEPGRVEEGLKQASMFVAGAAVLFARWANSFRSHANRLPLFDPEVSNAAGGDESIIYYHSYWKLEPEDALVIEVDPPDCEAWNFQLNNYWMESLDYRYHRISINAKSAEYEADGSVRIVVSHRDPGCPNWIETAGHREGTMCWRWYRLREGAGPVEPRCRVMSLNEFRSEI